MAVVRTPYGAGPHPVVLMLPGLDSTKEELGSTEQTFLDRGMATVTLDGPGTATKNPTTTVTPSSWPR